MAAGLAAETAATAAIMPERIGRIHDAPTLYTFLARELNWPLEAVPDTYEFFADELDLTENEAAQIKSVQQLAPFGAHQPWGIFLVEFAGDQVSESVLRRVLRGLSLSRPNRAASLPAWQADDLLFICTPNFQDFTFAHFAGRSHTQATLSRFGWKAGDPALRTLCEHNLSALRYPVQPENAETWRKQWAGAWDVERVTKRFYDDFFAVFKNAESLMEGMAPASGKDAAHAKKRTDEKTRLFTLRLFNRLMFVHFLSKMGWLRSPNGSTDYLYALWEGRDQTKNFYDNHLCSLFFAGLNHPASVRSDNDALRSLIGDVPFLNGGLFAQAKIDADDDGFPGDGCGEIIPDAVFETVINGLFRRYNFTIEESTPLNIHVAVDPEMLGKVFEELVTGRHDTGSYYTPRPIVAFMCREALKGYLGDTGLDAVLLSKLVDERDTLGLTTPQSRVLLAKLRSVTVCDPACGSGAYLLGMLQELFELIEILEVRADPLTPGDRYKRKLDIIQRNLYGADLDPFAVQIAMLRLWLSLVVNDTRRPLDDPTADVALPNLDFKIECGDSLTAPNADAARLTLDADAYRKDAARLAALYREFFQPASSSSRPKDAIKSDIARVRTEIAHLLGAAEKPGEVDWRVAFAQVFAPRAAASDVGSGGLPLGGTLTEPDVLGGFDIVVANPPYGAKVDDAVRWSFFDPKIADERGQSKDTYGLFLARALQLLRPAEAGHMGGQMSVIVSDTWRTIKSHRPLRRRFVEQTTIAHVLDLPAWIFHATVNTCILTLARGKPSAHHALIAGDLRPIKPGDWRTLGANLAAVAAHGPDVQTLHYARYTYGQSVIASYDNLSFFVGSPRLYGLMSDARFTKLGDLAEIKQGLATADNEYYLRKREGVRGGYGLLDESKLMTDAEIAALTDDEKRNGVDPAKYSGRHFVHYDKGGESDAEDGWMPNYHVPTGYFIDWSKEAVTRLFTATIADVKTRKGELSKIRASDKTARAAVVRNPQYYFRHGITFSPTGEYSPSYRLGGSGVFGNKGSTIFSNILTPEALLGYVNNNFARYLLKTYLSHTIETGEEVLGQLPLLQTDEAKAQLERLSAAIIEKQKADPRYPYHLHEQKGIDALVYELYGLTDTDIREVELWYCRRYEKLARAQNVVAEAQHKYADYLAQCEAIMAKPPGYWKSHPLLQTIARGESATLEFKESLEADIRNGGKNPGVVLGVLKTIAAFLNAPPLLPPPSENGPRKYTLLIGVSDGGEIKGLAPDMAFCQNKNEDGFELKLRNLIKDRLEPAPLGNVEITFERFAGDGVAVCRVDVEPRPGTVTHVDNRDVFVRDGNATLKLEGVVLAEWMRRRFSS